MYQVLYQLANYDSAPCDGSNKEGLESERLNSSVFDNWWELPVFRSLFGRAYYKVTYCNALLTKAYGNTFPSYVEHSTEVQDSDLLFWFDLNYLGCAFQLNKEYVLNVDKMLKRSSVEDYLKRIDQGGIIKDCLNNYC